MSRTNAARSKVSVVFAVTLTLLICVPFVAAIHNAYEKHALDEQTSENKHFSDIATMGKQYILGSLESMTESVYDTGLMFSNLTFDAESMEGYFSALYSSSQAEAGLVYASDGSLLFGDLEYGTLFYEIAREAQSSGGSSVSELIQCSDGIKRLGIASPFRASDGSTSAVLLLFSQQTLEQILADLNSNFDGELCVIDSDGKKVLCQNSGQSPAEEVLFAVDGEAIKKEELISVASSSGDAEYLAYIKPVGINNWLVVYLAEKQKTQVQSDVYISNIHLLGALTIFLLLTVVAYSIYRGNQCLRRMELFRKKFRIATSQSARAAFEYDRRTNKLTFISDSEHVMLPKPHLSLSELGNLVHPADRAAYLQSVAELRGQGSTSTTVRVFNFCGKEVFRWYHITATLLTNKGEGKALTIGTVEDIDERENERLVLYEKATTDSLTGLCNRAESEKIINERLSRLEVKEHSVFAIFDLDDFKDINDDFGHDCGDKALIYFADKLRSTFRFGDVLGRIGGDEFVVYMTFTAEKEIVERRLKELMEKMLSGTTDNMSNIPQFTCSIGCCMASKGDTFDSVYKRADDALYESKAHGKKQYTIVD